MPPVAPLHDMTSPAPVDSKMLGVMLTEVGAVGAVANNAEDRTV